MNDIMTLEVKNREVNNWIVNYFRLGDDLYQPQIKMRIIGTRIVRTKDASGKVTAKQDLRYSPWSVNHVGIAFAVKRYENAGYTTRIEIE